MPLHESGHDPVGGAEVLSAELAAIHADPDALFGLALSGGGIRSASFNLGVLQALAKAQMLRRVDYMSTVSGGGYIGGWLTTWLARRIAQRADPDRKFAGSEAQVSNGDEMAEVFREELIAMEHDIASHPDPLPVRNVRDFGNFLTPTRGLLSLDTWAWVALYAANLLINASSMFAIVLVAVGFVWLFLAGWLFVVHSSCPSWMSSGVGGLACSPVMWTLVLAVLSVYALGREFVAINHPRRNDEAVSRPVRAAWWRWQPVVFGGAAALLVSTRLPAFAALRVTQPTQLTYALLSAMLVATAWTGGVARGPHGLPSGMQTKSGRGSGPAVSQSGPTGLRMFVCMAVAALTSIALLVAGSRHLGPYLWLQSAARSDLRRLVTLGPLLAVAVASVGFTLYLVMIGGRYHAAHHEWWSRMAALNGRVTVLYSVTLATVFLSPRLVDPLADGASPRLFAIWTGTFTALLLVIGAGRWLRSRRAGLGGRMMAGGAAAAAGALVVLGVAGAEKALQHLSGRVLTLIIGPISRFGGPWDNLLKPLEGLGNRAGAQSLSVAVAIAAVLSASLILFVGVINVFSLHSAYRLRIARAFLGASSKSAPDDVSRNDVSGYAESDDMRLQDLVYRASDGSARVPRPYHLMNTAINLSGASDLTWQQRRSGAFLFSPLFCGYELFPSGHESAIRGYRPTDRYMSANGGVLLGTALAMSGAATSPNMGTRTSTVLAFLMTVFNVRLGRWCPNPAREQYERPDPPNDVRYLISELMGRAGAETKFVYLSDGGHFENTGAYELVRRRCQLIIAVDCGADPSYAFADIVGLIRRCRIDFGADIDIDLDRLRPTGTPPRSESAVAVGRIRYAPNGGPAEGVLVLIKPILVATMPADVLAYSRREASFPQVATSDQWFDEAQFETYRMLGHWLCEDALTAGPVREAIRQAVGDVFK